MHEYTNTTNIIQTVLKDNYLKATNYYKYATHQANKKALGPKIKLSVVQNNSFLFWHFLSFFSGTNSHWSLLKSAHLKLSEGEKIIFAFNNVNIYPEVKALCGIP